MRSDFCWSRGLSVSCQRHVRIHAHFVCLGVQPLEGRRHGSSKRDGSLAIEFDQAQVNYKH